MKKVVFVFLLFVISVSVFAKTYHIAQLIRCNWLIQPNGLLAISLDPRIIWFGVYNRTGYEFFSKKYYLADQEVENYNPKEVGKNGKGNYIVLQDTLKNDSGEIKYITRNYKIKDIKNKEQLVLEIEGKEYTFKYKAK